SSGVSFPPSPQLLDLANRTNKNCWCDSIFLLIANPDPIGQPAFAFRWNGDPPQRALGALEFVCSAFFQDTCAGRQVSDHLDLDFLALGVAKNDFAGELVTLL